MQKVRLRPLNVYLLVEGTPTTYYLFIVGHIWQLQMQKCQTKVCSGVLHRICICLGRYLYFQLYLRSDTSLQYMHYGWYQRPGVYQRSPPWRPCLLQQIVRRIDLEQRFLDQIWSRVFQLLAASKLIWTFDPERGYWPINQAWQYGAVSESALSKIKVNCFPVKFTV